MVKPFDTLLTWLLSWMNIIYYSDTLSPVLHTFMCSSVGRWALGHIELALLMIFPSHLCLCTLVHPIYYGYWNVKEGESVQSNIYLPRELISSLNLIWLTILSLIWWSKQVTTSTVCYSGLYLRAKECESSGYRSWVSQVWGSLELLQRYKRYKAES